MQYLPRARKAELVVEDLPSETIVYDLTCHKAHCLNKTASFIWQQCDGQTSIEELANRLAEITGLPPDPDVVRVGLRELSHSRLLVDEMSNDKEAPTRRELARRLAVLGTGAVAAIPVITSIVAPTPAMAKSDHGHGPGPGKGKGKGSDKGKGKGKG